jgi:hypothetical protein
MADPTLNPVQQSIRAWIDGVPAELAALASQVERYGRFCSSIDPAGTLQVGHQPWLASERYAIRIFAPARKAWFARFKERLGIPIPPWYRDFLLVANGCFVHGLTMYGLPPSMQSSSPLLDRRGVQPLDLAQANSGWKRSYAAVGPDEFYIGGRHYSPHDNSGYFATGRRIRAVLRKSGEVVGEWGSLGALLVDELRESELADLHESPAEWWH